MKNSVLLVAPIHEPLSRSAQSASAIHAYDMVSALVMSANMDTGLNLAVVAARGSTIDAPIISVDPTELGAASTAIDELLLHAAAMSGAFGDYDVLHCLAPAPTVVHTHARNGGKVLYTPGGHSDPLLLGALARLERIEIVDLETPVSIQQALHPVDLARISFGSAPRTKLYRARESEPPDSKHEWTTIASPNALVAGDGAVVLGPTGASPFEHVCWATRALASGAAYVHDSPSIDGFCWPKGGVLRELSNVDSFIVARDREPESAERYRKWALAHCSQAATASGLRRRYARMTSA